MSAEPEEEIEVGANAAELRLWIARQALRSGEVRLTAQAQNIAAMETRATAILAWAIAIGVALVASASQGRLLAVAGGAGLCLLLAAAFSIAALWPGPWHPPGYSWREIQAMTGDSELALTEAIAAGYEAAIDANDRRTVRFARRLQITWCCFLGAPLAGALAAGLAMRA